jgi:hypothetical protein
MNYDGLHWQPRTTAETFLGSETMRVYYWYYQWLVCRLRLQEYLDAFPEVGLERQ